MSHRHHLRNTRYLTTLSCLSLSLGSDRACPDTPAATYFYRSLAEHDLVISITSRLVDSIGLRYRFSRTCRHTCKVTSILMFFAKIAGFRSACRKRRFGNYGGQSYPRPVFFRQQQVTESPVPNAGQFCGIFMRNDSAQTHPVIGRACWNGEGLKTMSIGQ